MKNLNRKIFIAFCLISIIPLLVSVYLILSHLFPTAIYAGSISVIVFITTVIVILGFFLLLGISRNITKLSTSANIIAKGDLTHNVQIKDNDETVELASSLNRITQRLREDMNALETRTILVERTNKELNRSNKLKSEFVSMVSHELFAPLINIKQTVSLLLTKQTGQINIEQERFLAVVERNVKRLLKLISDLLDISKLEAGELRLNRQTINIGNLIREAAESLERWREVKKISLKLEVESNLPDIYTASDRINQMLVNLLSNAIKFTPAGGRITIEATAQKKDGFLEISVIDTGIGIPSNQLENIFDRFRQVDTIYSGEVRGAGLGLSITKEIVTVLGGRIWVESRQGQGSKFTFTIPITEAKERLSKNIMIVDDESVVVETLTKLLNKLGYSNLSEAYSGDEVFQKLRTGIPDLLILDMRMPGMSGYEVIDRLKVNDNTRDMPVLIISGYEIETERLKQYNREKSIPIMNKPIDAEQLKRLISHFL